MWRYMPTLEAFLRDASTLAVQPRLAGHNWLAYSLQEEDSFLSIFEKQLVALSA